MDYFKFLPAEITIDIISRVPIESVLDCKLVSKTWRNHVRHPSFSKTHLYHLNHPSNSNDSGKLGFLALAGEYNENKRYCEFFRYFEYNKNHDEPIQRITRFNFTTPFIGKCFVGSCDGLICLAGMCLEQDLSVCICNPITRQLVMLPDIKRECESVCHMHWMIGFGYVSSTDEYKVVGIYEPKSKTHMEVHIYTLGSGSGWRNLGMFSNFGFNGWDKTGTFANGALYWLDNKSQRIATFDLAEEKFCQHLSPPPAPAGLDRYCTKIGVYDGFLYILIRLVVPGVHGHDEIWLLKKKSLNHEMKERNGRQSLGWSKAFMNDCRVLLTTTKSGDVLTFDGSNFYIYDTKSLTSEWLFRMEDWYHQVAPHKNTLMSLQEIGEEDTKTMEPVKLRR